MLDGAVIDKAPLAFVSQWVEIQKQQVDLLVQKAILLALRDLLSKAYMPPRTPRRPRIRLRILGASKHRRSARGLRQAPRGRRPMQPGTRMLDESQSQSSALPDTVCKPLSCGPGPSYRTSPAVSSLKRLADYLYLYSYDASLCTATACTPV
ncbi:hypothetical protein B0H14DRAFT_2727396, partial [Mycena olivaceomarginata]